MILYEVKISETDEGRMATIIKGGGPVIGKVNLKTKQVFVDGKKIRFKYNMPGDAYREVVRRSIKKGG